MATNLFSDQVQNISNVPGSTVTDALNTIRESSATGGGTERVMFINEKTINTNFTVPAGFNALSAGPMTINATVTVADGSTYVVI